MYDWKLRQQDSSVNKTGESSAIFNNGARIASMKVSFQLIGNVKVFVRQDQKGSRSLLHRRTGAVINNVFEKIQSFYHRLKTQWPNLTFFKNFGVFI